MIEISESELIELARQEQKKTDVSILDVEAFCKSIGIKEGKEKIFAKDLYGFYSKWSNNPLTLRKFIKQMSNIILHKHGSGKKYYRINITDLELSVKVDARNENKKEQG